MDMNPIHAEALAHHFTPSCPGGSVCVEPCAVSAYPDTELELCGQPATHPVHRVDGPPSGMLTRIGDALAPQMRSRHHFEAGADVTVPAEGSRERTMERRFLLRGRLQQVAVIATERGLVAAAAEIERILDEVLRIPTPAEAVTGTSDRAHAALTVVAELRQRALTSTGIERQRRIAQLDLIEAALRETRR